MHLHLPVGPFCCILLTNSSLALPMSSSLLSKSMSVQKIYVGLNMMCYEDDNANANDDDDEDVDDDSDDFDFLFLQTSSSGATYREGVETSYR